MKYGSACIYVSLSTHALKLVKFVFDMLLLRSMCFQNEMINTITLINEPLNIINMETKVNSGIYSGW